MNIKTVFALFISAFYISAFAGPMDQGAGQHRMPPKEAIDACSGKAKDDACSFTGPGGNSLEGICHSGPDGKGVLACAPKPPKEAVDACSGKNDGDTCSFTGKNGQNIEGSCGKTPMGDVACRPKMHGQPNEMGKDMSTMDKEKQ